MLDDIRNRIAGLKEKDRLCLLNELLVAYVRTIDDERLIMDETGEAVGTVIPVDQRCLLISSELLDRIENGPYKSATKPMSEILKNLPCPRVPATRE